MPSDRSSTLGCEDVRPWLAEAADPTSSLPRPAAAHLQTCLRCQAEMAQYRKLRRAMRSMQHDLLVADARDLEDVLELGRPLATVHRIHGGSGRRRAYIGGIAAAATAGAAGALVIASRITRHRLAS